jgi:hypothetical protein
VLGEGSSGAGGVKSTISAGGGGGSSGSAGTNSNVSPFGGGGQYGGGSSGFGSAASGGAVRIIWGAGVITREFPSTNTGNL